jgi:UDP-N-acetylglucosamine--N-acetylmuramyl-(pentapeptide) pyrophosphoryl-undecaprenol N-acetylglucosamine transferase
MTQPIASSPHIAIACGGTGGHLFPGLAVAEQLVKRGCKVTLLISPKEVDQQGVRTATGLEIVTLPAVAFQSGSRVAFVRSFWKSWMAARRLFKTARPDAVLAMGGFTAAPPVLAGKAAGARTFLHESNTIPGRANRWLSRFVTQAFVGFPQTAARLRCRKVVVTGTPVRPQFQPADAKACRMRLGLDPARTVILVMGGSQGASGINEMVLSALPLLAGRAAEWQWLHLAGANDVEKVKQAYAAAGWQAVVHPFFAQMDLALGAAAACVSRAGASSLAELAAMRLPSLLVPYPAAADNHQYFNARVFAESGAAQLLEQKGSTPERFAAMLNDLVENAAQREIMREALGSWHSPGAAAQIAEMILKSAPEPVAPAPQGGAKAAVKGEINLRAVA